MRIEPLWFRANRNQLRSVDHWDELWNSDTVGDCVGTVGGIVGTVGMRGGGS